MGACASTNRATTRFLRRTNTSLTASIPPAHGGIRYFQESEFLEDVFT